MRKCPFCAEDIQDEAIKCKHCKEWLEEIPLVNASEYIDKVDNKILSPDDSNVNHKESISNKQEKDGKLQCPQCKKWDVYQTILKNGGLGDYCPHCKRSLMSMGVIQPRSYRLMRGTLNLGLNSFQWRGKEYPYTSVRGLKYYLKTITLGFLVTVSRTYLRFAIFIDGEKNPITINDSPFFHVMSISEYTDAYINLANGTFVFRAERYLKELKKHGYFSYDQAKFYLDGKVVIEFKNFSQSFNIHDPKIRTKPFKIFFKSSSHSGSKIIKNCGLWTNLLKNERSGLFQKTKKTNEISTDINKDVLFFLLEKLYGVKLGS